MSDQRYAARTDVGRRREHNEDSVLAAPPLFVVADGVGGAEAGEIASQTAVEVLAGSIQQVIHADDEAVAQAELERLVHAANEQIVQQQATGNGTSNMATTLTAAVIWRPDRVLIAHVGDSRAYLVDDVGITQLTDDHSIVGELIRTGEITSEQANRHPQRNVITRALGAEESVIVDIIGVTPTPGAVLVLCSDGLTGHVDEDEIAAEIRVGGQDPALAAQALIDIANERGGSDNISVVIAQPVPRELAPPGGWETGAPPQGTGEIRMPDLSSATPGPTPEPVRPPSTPQGQRHMPRWLWLALASFALSAVAVVGWSNSYYLVERDNGRVGINQGFPILGLNRAHATGQVSVEDLPASDRESLVEKTTLRSKRDAERLLRQLPERADAAATPSAEDA